MYAELVYFDGAHFAHIARYYDHMRSRQRLTTFQYHAPRIDSIRASATRLLAAAAVGLAHFAHAAS